MKIIKLLPLLLILTLFNTKVAAQEDCSQIKNNSSVNILKKLKCKSTGSSEFSTQASDAQVSDANGEKKSGWKLWKKPEWMKKKN